MTPLSDAQINEKLAALPHWRHEHGVIVRDREFADFAEAMRFVNRVADAAEAAKHHPDILVRYNKVTLSLSTHDAGGITQTDFALAAILETLA